MKWRRQSMPTSKGDATEDLLDLYENAPCGYLSLAPNGTIVRANQTLVDWLQCPVETVLEQPFRDLLGTGGSIAYETHLAPLLRMQGFVYEIALDLRCGSQLLPVIANASEKRDADGNHVSTRLTLFRAEDRRKYERNLLESKLHAEAETRQREREGKLREQFVAVLGHDLRNPVAALKSGVRVLMKAGDLNPQKKRVLEVMNTTLDRSIDLIENIMDLARGRLGSGLSLDLAPETDLDQKIEDLLDEIRAAHPDRELLSTLEIKCVVHCDAGRLTQLLANLVTNALHHGSSDTPVEIHAQTSAGELILSVTNSGPAIPPDVIETLFEPFNRGKSVGNRGGLGLGLYIVDLIANAHGGRAQVETNDDFTTFKFTMPIGSEQA